MHFKYLAFFGLIFMLACKKPTGIQINNLNNGKCYVIGHAGIGITSYLRRMPENSMLSITTAIGRYGADGVEVDVQLTKDGVLVLYHDNGLETSTNGIGTVYEHTLNELQQFKYDNHYFNSVFLNENIASLEEVLIYFTSLKKKPQLHLDLRHWLYDSEKYSQIEFFSVFAKEINRLILKYNYQDYTYISSTNFTSLQIIKQQNDKFKLLYETKDIINGVDLIKDNDLYGLLSQRRITSASDVKYAHQNNVFVCLFGVVTKNDIYDAIDKNVDFIMTDNIQQSIMILYP